MVQKKCTTLRRLLGASACNTDTTPTQLRRNSNTHRTKNNTTNVVIQQISCKLLMMDILMSETCWAHKKWNKIASDIKLVFYSSTTAMMHGPINISLLSVLSISLEWNDQYCFLGAVVSWERRLLFLTFKQILAYRACFKVTATVYEVSVLLGYYSASLDICSSWTLIPLKKRTLCCVETTGTKYLRKTDTLAR